MEADRQISQELSIEIENKDLLLAGIADMNLLPLIVYHEIDRSDKRYFSCRNNRFNMIALTVKYLQ